MTKRTPEQIEADRAAVLSLCDGTRGGPEVARISGISYGDVCADVAALRRAGHACPIAPKARNGKSAVYRQFDASGALLYVGCSVSPQTRSAMHASVSRWFEQVARIEIEWFPSIAEARLAEREAIRAERPRYNVRHAGDAA